MSHLICRNFGCCCSDSKTADQMCRHQSWAHLTAEEQLAAEESFSLYCKPVELYNILQRRSTRNVTSFNATSYARTNSSRMNGFFFVSMYDFLYKLD